MSDDESCHLVDVDGQTVRVRGLGEMDEESSEALTALVRVATRRFADDQAAIVQQVIALRREWTAAGAPPLGTSLSRWWDTRLVELDSALTPPEGSLSQPGATSERAKDKWAYRLIGILADLDRCQHGRHEGDPCGSCGGLSTGNPYLAPGRVIGHGAYGKPIVLPIRDHKADPAAWRATTPKDHT